MHRQRTAIARLQFVKSLAPVAAKRLVIGYALGEQQSFDPVNVLDPLGGQRLALTAKPAIVFVFGHWRGDNGADARFAPFVSQQRTDQCLAINPIGLGSPPPA